MVILIIAKFTERYVFAMQTWKENWEKLIELVLSMFIARKYVIQK
jgi:hypothetical protein